MGSPKPKSILKIRNGNAHSGRIVREALADCPLDSAAEDAEETKEQGKVTDISEQVLFKLKTAKAIDGEVYHDPGEGISHEHLLILAGDLPCGQAVKGKSTDPCKKAHSISVERTEVSACIGDPEVKDPEEEFQKRTKETNKVRRNVCEGSEGEVAKELRTETAKKDLPAPKPIWEIRRPPKYDGREEGCTADYVSSFGAARAPVGSIQAKCPKVAENRKQKDVFPQGCCGGSCCEDANGR